MHEHSLMKNLVRRVEEVVRAEGALRAVAVRLRVGAGAHLTPDHLREHFVIAARGTAAEGAELELAPLEGPADPLAPDIVLESVSVEA